MKKNKTIIIAEAGINHNGSLKRAIKMIKIAKECNADFIKFQTAVPSLVVKKNAKKANYQKTNLNDNETQLNMITKLHLPLSNYKILKDECKKKSIGFLSSPFDLKSISYLNSIGCKYVKIPSGEINNYPFLKKIAKYKFKIILSTGMSKLYEIKDALKIFYKFKIKKQNIILLHCNSAYPTPYIDVNLSVIESLKNKFNLEVGFSDHTQGNLAAISAVVLGAKVIEKHFTLNRNLKGPDHQSSLNPKEFKEMVIQIRNVETLIGDPLKKVTTSEKENLKIVRKSIVAKIDINKGEIFSESNLTTKRPGTGISPMKWDLIIGTKSKKNYKQDDFINE